MQKVTTIAMLLVVHIGTIAMAADESTVVSQKLLPDGRKVILNVKKTFVKKEDVKISPDRPAPPAGKQWSEPEDHEVRHYTLVVREESGKTTTVFETKTTVGLAPRGAGDLLSRVDVFDVVQKEDQIAILLGNARDVEIMIIQPRQPEGYAIMFRHMFFERRHFSKAQGAGQQLADGKISWLDDLYVVFRMIPSNIELWRVRKDGAKKLYEQSHLGSAPDE